MSEDVSQPADLGVATADDFMSFADDPSNEVGSTPASETAEQPQGEEQGEQETPAAGEFDPAAEEAPQSTAQEVSYKGIRDEVVAVMKSLAEANGDYDLSNPTVFKLVRQAAEKELRIRELTPASDDAKNYLAAFEEPEGAQPPAAAATDGTAGQDIPPFVKIAREWTNPGDFAESLLSAYEMPDGPEKNERLAHVYMGLQDRLFHQTQLPVVQQLVENMLRERLGPAMQQSASVIEETRNRQVFETLKKAEPEIDGLFEDTGLGDVVVDGETVQGNWLNHILARHPHISKLVEFGKDGKTIHPEKTLATRYHAAYEIMKHMREGNNGTAAASALIRTGQAIEKSKRDPVRTGVNAGKAGAPTSGRGEEDLFGGGSDVTFGSLFK